MRRVAHVSTLHSRYDTRIFRRECVYLAKFGFDVSYFVNDGGVSEEREGVTIVPVANNKSTLYRKLILPIKLFFDIWNRFDIVHFHDPELVPFGLLVRFFSKSQVVYDVHENYRCHSLITIYNKWQEVLNHLAGRYLNLVFAETSYADKYPVLANSINVLNFADLEFFRSYEIREIKTDRLNLVYIGGVNADRGLREVIDALSRICEQVNLEHFHIIGPVRSDSELEYIKGGSFLKIADKVTFYGHRSLEDAYSIARECNVGVAITLPTQNYRESLSTKVFEYMAIGLPSLYSDFDIYGNLRETAVGVPVRPTEKGIEDGILRLSKASTLEASNIACLINRSKFSVNSELDKLRKFYEAISSTS